MMHVKFNIIRQSPDQSPFTKSYELTVNPGHTILDCLNQIKWELDGSLAFRKNCRNTICGSCAMRINGRSTLACKENIQSEVKHASTGQDGIPDITIAPLGNLPVVRDLIVDMNPFWGALQAIQPHLTSANQPPASAEFLQSPEERSRLNQLGNCILCGACYSECNALEVNPAFVGPHALAKAYRTLVDSRDDQQQTRLEQYNQSESGVWGCTRCQYCNVACPMDVEPMEQIGKIKQQILAKSTAEDSRAIRHRKVLVDLVKEDGWIDERKFGLRVVSNYFRDWSGLMSLGPLGLRMLARGKFPLTFDKSAGASEVRSLIESLQQLPENKGA